jgi:hypothetical protein
MRFPGTDSQTEELKRTGKLYGHCDIHHTTISKSHGCTSELGEINRLEFAAPTAAMNKFQAYFSAVTRAEIEFNQTNLQLCLRLQSKSTLQSFEEVECVDERAITRTSPGDFLSA